MSGTATTPANARRVAPTRGSARPAIFEVIASEHPGYPVGKLLTVPRSRGSKRRKWSFASDEPTPRMLFVAIEFRRPATFEEWLAYNAEQGYAPPPGDPMDVQHLKPQEAGIILHALGIQRRGGKWTKPYRNYFVTGEGTADWPVCCGLVVRGLLRVRSRAVNGGDVTFEVIEKFVGKAEIDRCKQLCAEQIDA